jgi:hypothetical protein
MKMKTLARSFDREDIVRRVWALSPDSQRRWGRMSVAQMLCHLSDSFRAPLGEKPALAIDNWFTRSLFKWGALYLPMPWPHGVKTRPEMDAESGGTASKGFCADRDELLALLDRCMQLGPQHEWRHPMFGKISDAETMRWAYLHMDHHLRQFGV